MRRRSMLSIPDRTVVGVIEAQQQIDRVVCRPAPVRPTIAITWFARSSSDTPRSTACGRAENETRSKRIERFTPSICNGVRRIRRFGRRVEQIEEICLAAARRVHQLRPAFVSPRVGAYVMPSTWR